ncbi:MAG: class I SAM-dependent methyltransferase [Deltaproteobacteria bacterium]|nr:class I SAM-dependent methyltransferase [Candidatus Zymogenaceae bacterium]
MIYLYPVPSEKEEDRFYLEDFEGFMSERSGGDKDWSAPDRHFKANRAEVARRMKVLGEYVKPGGTLLEIGCSSGFMLDEMKKRGMDVYGIEPSKVYGEYTRALGIEVFNDFEGLVASKKDQFDLIIHYYVLEHIRNPVMFLEDVAKLGKKGGKMIFEVPSATEPLIETYNIDAFDKFYWSVVHHWYFTPDSLRRVLSQLNRPFELLPEQRYDLSNHMTWMHHGKPGGLGKYSEIFGEDLDGIYRERLKELWRCDTIIAVIDL